MPPRGRKPKNQIKEEKGGKKQAGIASFFSPGAAKRSPAVKRQKIEQEDSDKENAGDVRNSTSPQQAPPAAAATTSPLKEASGGSSTTPPEACTPSSAAKRRSTRLSPTPKAAKAAPAAAKAAAKAAKKPAAAKEEEQEGQPVAKTGRGRPKKDAAAAAAPGKGRGRGKGQAAGKAPPAAKKKLEQEADADAEPAAPTAAAMAARAAPHPSILVGATRVEKRFKRRLYRGTVAAFDAEEGFYRVEYDDGDADEMEEAEVLAALVPEEKEGKEEEKEEGKQGAKAKRGRTTRRTPKKETEEGAGEKATPAAAAPAAAAAKKGRKKGKVEKEEEEFVSPGGTRRPARRRASGKVVSYKEATDSEEEEKEEEAAAAASDSEVEFGDEDMQAAEESEEAEAEEEEEEEEEEAECDVEDDEDDVAEVFKKKMTSADLKGKKKGRGGGGGEGRKKKAACADDAGDAADWSSGAKVAELPMDQRGRHRHGDEADLEVLVKPQDMFDHLVGQVPEMARMVADLGRPLRVATMCSGTESPLLALDMIARAGRARYGARLAVEHVFSCEIEPFKQAYIERNFAPPLLFRDIRELGREKATTAYGAEAAVPGEVDILIAGTSCVDYSNLNNDKKGIDQKGESGQTFRGMMDWVEKTEPPVVILENVCGAPWEEVCKRFRAAGYHADFLRVDTKYHYIPHTRTRGYMCAVRRTPGEAADPALAEALRRVPGEWKNKVRWLERPSSSTLEAFILPSDDPRVHAARRALSGRTKLDGTARAQVDWGRCESRHQRARQEEALGGKRPLTGWEEGGQCKLADFAWNDWGKAQVDRVLDLMDINTLRLAAKGEDANYKTLVWNLSQNVDRSTASSKPGVCPCLTPSMVPYVTNRGGPLIGLEALSLQGIPVDDLLLTRESEDNMADLAGNAMSSTVVGTCTLAALCLAKDALAAAPWAAKRAYPKGEAAGAKSPAAAAAEGGKKGAAGKRKAGEVAGDEEEEEVRAALALVEGEERLTAEPMALGDTPAAAATKGKKGGKGKGAKAGAAAEEEEGGVAALLAAGARAARRCVCEGRSGLAAAPLQACAACGHTTCEGCGGRPEHAYAPLGAAAAAREPPGAFEARLKAALPMRVRLAGFGEGALRPLRPEAWAKGKLAERWAQWAGLVAAALEGAELLFTRVERGEDRWVARYRAPNAEAELVLRPAGPEWRVGLARTGLPRRDPLAAALRRPVARLRLDPAGGAGGLLGAGGGGGWEVCLPVESAIDATLTGCGELVDAWEARLGLVGKEGEFQRKRRWSAYEVAVPEEQKALLDGDITGRYEWLDKCATAAGALHKQVLAEGEAGKGRRPFYLFLDPDRTGKAAFDFFVFAHEHRRLAYGERRGHVAQLDGGKGQLTEGEDPGHWRPSDAAGPQAVRLTTTGQWAALQGAAFAAVAGEGVLARPAAPLALAAGAEACAAAAAVTYCEVPLPAAALAAAAAAAGAGLEATWPEGRWRTLDLQRSRATFEALGWFTQRLALPAALTEWAPAEGAAALAAAAAAAGARSPCERCAPAPPEVLFVNVGGSKVEPREHPKQAGVYEQRLKHRPAPFVVQLRRRGATGAVRVGLNAASLLHRALADLPAARRAGSAARLRADWRVVPHADHAAPPPRARLHLTSNRRDPAAAQPPRFARYPLRPEQQRSLWWMLRQEAAPPAFEEEEVAEAVLGPLGWRAEARAAVPVEVRGGIVADQVGYGKTVITLGLVDAAPEPPPLPPAVARGRVPTKATLVLAPPHLLKQWPKEVVKFTGAHFKVVAIKTMADLNRLTVKEVQGADLVVCATTVLRSDMYFQRLGELAGNGEDLPARAGRMFEAVYAKKLAALEERVAELQGEPGPAAVAAAVRAGRQIRRDLRANAAELKDHLGNTEKRLNLGKSKKATYKAEKEAKGSKKTAAKGGKGKKRKAEESEEDEEEEYEEEEMELDSGDEEVVASTKGKKAGAKGKKGSKGKAAAGGGGGGPKAKKGGDLGDVWGLGSASVKKDWRNLRSPPLEAFAWRRLVVDEFTYLSGRDRTAILGTYAQARWCLSGTPPCGDFDDINGMAAFLGLSLGCAEATSTKQLKDSTRAEKFAFFKEMRTPEWHARRHRRAQEFLDKFVRQNIAEIDEIRAEEHLALVQLTPAERAIYLELDHHLQAMEMKTKKSIKSKKDRDSDRDARLREMLGASGSAEEALLKRCSHYDLQGASKSAEAACEAIIAIRQEQLDECKKDIVAMLKEADKKRQEVVKADKGYATDPEEPHMRWVRSLYTEGADGCGDDEALAQLRAVLEGAGVKAPAPAEKKRDASGDGEALKALKWALREKVHDLRKLQKELVGRVRSLRYFQMVRDLQQRDLRLGCPACGRGAVPRGELGLLSCCGHAGCHGCLLERADRQECPAPGCLAPARVSAVVRAGALGTDRDHKGAGEFGTKLARVVECIEGLPQDDRVLVFVQFPDLMQQVAAALEAAGIKTLQLKGSVHKKTAALEVMQKETMDKNDPRVLLLFLHDESASGANLTNANHAIFIHPLLAQTQQEYTQAETQSIGRVRRYGQKKTVHVRRFLAEATMDTQIYEQRSRAWDDGMKR